MNTYTALIVDDEPHAIGLLKLCLHDLYPSVQVTNACTDWKEALQALRAHSYDLVFLDVMMPGRTGLDLARLLPGISGHIIFVTAHEEYAMEAFKCYAAGYLLKPLDEQDLSRLLDRLLTRPPQGSLYKKQQLLGIPGVNGIDYIDTDAILYLQADHKCTKIVLADKIMYSSYNLGMFREHLGTSFFQVHRSYIIRLSAVKRYRSSVTTIVMENDMEIPVARAAKNELLQQFKTLNRTMD